MPSQRRRADLVVAKAEPGKPKPVTEGKLVFKDDFAKAIPELWEMGPGTWKYERNHLIQQKTGDGRSNVRAKTAPPTDFEARLRFTITGGDPYKSVGIAFDVGDGNEAMVYVSAYSSGNKVQVTYKNGGDYLYPADGATEHTHPSQQANRTVDPRSRHSCKRLARWQPRTRVRAAHARKAGKLDLITYTASAEFAGFELRELPRELELLAPGNKPGVKFVLTPEIAQASAIAAERAVTAAEAEFTAVATRRTGRSEWIEG